MIDKNLFLETLHEVAEIAATSGEKNKTGGKFINISKEWSFPRSKEKNGI